MTKTNLKTNTIAALLLALFFGVSSATTVVAQNGNTAGTGTAANRAADRDDDTDWGWIGLLGLAGLLGLMPKKRVVDNDHNRTGNNR
jgi:uncharacterized protein YceK